jgi:hypothetical protein
MKLHPPSGRDWLIALVLIPFSAILIHFALEPERFSSDALNFTYYIMLAIFSFVLFLLGRPNSNFSAAIVSALTRFLKR